MENHNQPARSDDSSSWQSPGASFDQTALSAGLQRDCWGGQHTANSVDSAPSAQSSQVGAELGQLFSKFTSQGNVMTDADWNTFGKIFLDLSSDPYQAARPEVLPAHPGVPHANLGVPHAHPEVPHAHPGVPHAHHHHHPGTQAAQLPRPADQPRDTGPLPQAAVQPKETDRPPALPLDRVAPPAVTDRGGEINFPAQHGPVVKGSEFFRDVLHASSDNPQQRGLTGAEREKAILKQVEAGNIPDFLRHPKEITVRDKSGNVATMKVMPDYLAIGTNDDFVRVPVTPVLAKTIAEKYGLALPTKKVVDDIYQNADIRLTGQGLVHDMSDTKYMDGNGFYLKHNKKISEQLAGKPQDALVAGHKKDIIVSKYAQNNPDRLDFYGLFDKDGHAIQGAHGGPHENTYVDYSHGARFICQDMVVNGKHMTYDQVLKDKQLSGLLSDEGPVQTASIYKQPKYADYMEVA